MKTTILGLAATAVLLLTATTVQANDRGFRDNGNAAWRLGERNRDGYSIYRRQGGNWYRVPGSGIAVGDGWVLGNKRENGGYAIYRWNGHDWDQAPGGAVEIGGTYNRPWVINDRGQRFNWNGYDWNRGGFVGNGRGFARDNRYDRDFRNRQDRRERERYRNDRRNDRDYRNRDRNRFFNRRDRSWDPYRYDERRRFGKDRFYRRR